jgi:hypothetical protein
MRIVLKRSGGFAGISQTMSISTDQMPAVEAQKVTSLVQQAGFFALPPVIDSAQPGADRFQYQITVENEQGAHTVQVDESAVPPGLQPLLDWMKNSARTQAGK